MCWSLVVPGSLAVPWCARLLTGSNALVFNLDKCGYASDLASIEALPEAKGRHQLLQLDLADAEATASSGAAGRSRSGDALSG